MGDNPVEDTIELLKRLIRTKPVSADVPAVNRATDLLRRYLAEHDGLHCDMEHKDGRDILYAATRQTKTPDVLLNVHLDVVPAREEQFVPVEKKGWLHGRGSSDCLGCAAIAAQALIRCRTPRSVGVIFSSDEEVGGETTAHMVRRGYGANAVILVIDGAPYAIAVAQKGVLTLSLRATGKTAHSSTPWLGENAIDRLIDGYLEIRGLFPDVAAGDEWHNTLAATVVSGGTASNRIPDEARLTINVRYTEAGAPARILQRIRDLSGLEAEPAMTCPPVVFGENTPLFRQLAETMEDCLGTPISLIRMNGATDARHFVGLGVPIAIIGIPGLNVHGENESAEIRGIRAYEDMLVEFLNQET